MGNAGARGNHQGCSAVGNAGAVQRWEVAGPAESTGTVRRCRLVVVRGDTSAAFAVMPGGVRGDARGHWTYVLRASLKTQFPSDFLDFVGFIPLAQRRLGR